MRKFRSLVYLRYRGRIGDAVYDRLNFNYHHVFYRSLIFRGRKIWAFNFFSRLKRELKLREQWEPSLVFLVAMMKITPAVLLSPIKNAGIVSYAPSPITPKKKITVAVKWVLKLLKPTSRVTNVNAVADLLVSAIYNKGPSMHQKRDTYIQAIRNRDLLRFFK